MSHFSYLRTAFQNLVYLEKALKLLKFEHATQKQVVKVLDKEFYHVNLIIPKPNGYDIKFDWNGQEYELVVDRMFWEEAYPVESFVNKVAQKYAGEAIVGEGLKNGFQPIKYEQNNDGSNLLILERWNPGN